MLAVNEAVTNVLDYSGGAGTPTRRVRPGAGHAQIEDTAGWRRASTRTPPRSLRPRCAGTSCRSSSDLCDRAHLQRASRGALLVMAG
ncbi:hypothetical protein ACIBK9_49905 [Nonomuraea sp. NPDC050227]|uniref:hypothetical protein n=1 Tax=Nonomuraea sp. NPDC050227 TaxID=3364360 RepID=UPI0037B460A4